MAAGLQDQLTSAGMTAMSFEERIALLVEREAHWRSDKRRERLLKDARLKYPQAAIEGMDTRAGRGVDHKAVMSLALGDWIDSGHSVLITGPTGAGKSWLACALAQYACRRGRSAYYQRMPRLGEELRIRHGNGTFGKWLIQLAKTDVLLLDDRGMAGSTFKPAAICWTSSTDGRLAKPPSSRANCRLSTGTHGWVAPRSLTRSLND